MPQSEAESSLEQPGARPLATVNVELERVIPATSACAQSLPVLKVIEGHAVGPPTDVGGACYHYVVSPASKVGSSSKTGSVTGEEIGFLIAKARLILPDGHDCGNSSMPSNDDLVLVVEAQPLRRLILMKLLALFIVAILVLGVTTGVTFIIRTRRNPNNDVSAPNHHQQPPQTTMIAPEAVVNDFRNRLPNHTLDALQDVASPQYKAYDWVTFSFLNGEMQDDDQQDLPLLVSSTIRRMTQRFALATLYFATGGTGFHGDTGDAEGDDGATSFWLKTTGWLNHSSHECEWFGCKCIATSTEENRTISVLQSLDLGHNRLKGTLPREIGLLSTLESLKLNRNALTGPIPTEIGLLANLSHVSLSQNYLSGPIPTELGQLTNLEFFYAAENQLTGPILATELGILTSLKELDFSMNKLTGMIPTEFGLLTSNLQWLDLSKQRLLSGTIPAELFLLSNLSSLSLFGNSLTGTIPSEIGMLTNLKQLFLDTNALTGTIPSTIGKLSRLRVLDIYRDELQGSVPFEVCGLISYGLELRIDCTEVDCNCGCHCFY